MQFHTAPNCFMAGVNSLHAQVKENANQTQENMK